MFYKFNNIIGRIVPSAQAEAYTPQGLNPVTRPPPVIIFDSKKTKAVLEPEVIMQPAAAAGSVPKTTSAALVEGLGVVPSNKRYQKIMQIQNMLLKDDGKLVWQKFGSRDRVTYFITLGLMMVGTVMSVTTLFRMAFPKKTED